ncbi:hypothetical protein TNCV_1150981 [Trichonephila clavipes]|nr:hypothetical protein TNCV_1150981 [Trichonephila clavipes]
MANDFVKVVRSVSFSLSRKPITYRDRVPTTIGQTRNNPLKYGGWTVLGIWNLREGAIILLFAQLIYARDGQRPYLSKK